MNIKTKNTLLRTILIPIFILTVMTSVNAEDEDQDQDGIPDLIDNCTELKNADQRDTDADGIGNLCDADLDNNGFVNSVDFSMFKQRLLSNDPDADLDGSGFVNSIDFSMFKQMLLKAPGPSNVVADPSFILAPPPAGERTIFSLDKPRENGDNAAIRVDFGAVSGLESVISINFEGKTIALNDAGILPDEIAGDNKYSAFFNFDFEQQVKQEEDLISRIESTEVTDFFGREIVAKRQITTEQSINAEALAITSSELTDGTVLTPINPMFDSTPTLPVAHDKMKSLMITDAGVIADQSRTFDICDIDGDGIQGNVNGVWSFKTLISNMASGGNISAQQFTHNWVQQWMSDQTVNSFTIPARTNIQNFFPGWDGINSSTLDMDRLPFRLLAVVNRIDLAKIVAYGKPSSGEIRFVFGLVDPQSLSCSSGGNLASTREMTVIFEYGDINDQCTTIKNRANQWIALSSLPLGSSTYNTALQVITDDVTLANAAPSKPNGSALNQLRTNEIALSFPWQLREFVIDSGNLVSTTIKQTPDPDLFRINSAVTAQYMENNAFSILCEINAVPEIFNSQPFLGSHADYGFGTIWNAPTDPLTLPASIPACTQTNVSSAPPSVQGELRHKLSLNTCDDCHSGETQTTFTHIKPGSFPISLSGFLTGVVVNDPGGETNVKREFNDLLRRGQVLESLTVKSCGILAFPGIFDPIIIFPTIESNFEFDPPEFDPSQVDFFRLQQNHNFTH